jgi:predicted DNA binding CopG/RHH family protein
MKTKLTKEEKEILDSFEKGEWIPVADLSKRRKELAQYARNTLRKDKRLNIRISERSASPERPRRRFQWKNSKR